MLQQILVDMFIEPELLAELNEEQKQVLFMKMREEQVRRWREREAGLEEEGDAVKKTQKDSSRRVSWLTGADSDVWVWVMGEHPSDMPYDRICDDIMAERAARQAQREAGELRVKKEAELLKRFSSVSVDSELLSRRREEERREEERREEERREEERQKEERQKEERQKEKRQERARLAAQEQKQREEELKRREAEERRRAEEAEERRRAEEEVKRLEEERKQQIYMDLKEVREEREDRDWQDSLRKSKAADLRRRSMAKQTREDHRRRSVKALERGRVAAVARAFGGEKPALMPKPKPRNLTVTSDALNPRKQGVRRTQSSSGREHIIQWFRQEQLPLRAGFEKDQTRIAPWFHGIISRQEAEDLLSDGTPGHFLVRVSERILGYVLSYRCNDAFKHFLIDATEGCYMLLGDQIRFSSLAELVDYHEGEPITMSGGEQLLQACGQKAGNLDYADLFT